MRKTFEFSGLELSYLDNKASGPAILIAHANGFSAQCYETYVTALSNKYRVLALDFAGHSYSQGTLDFSDWNFFRDQIFALLEHEKLEKVRGIGHSLGGICLLKAAQFKPDAFEQVVALDPVALGYLKILFVKIFGNPLARQAKKRRRTFRSYQVAYKVLAKHPFFKGFDRDVFKDYIESCFRPAGNPEVEAKIFSTPSFANFSEALKVACRVDIVTPNKSFVCPPSLARKLSRNGGKHHTCPEGGHLFPFEKVEYTLKKLRELLN